MRLGTRVATTLQRGSVFSGGWQRAANSNSGRVRQSTPTLPKLPAHAPASTAASDPAREPVPATPTERYAIKVFTGDMRGAGTRAEVFATLIGDRGESARHVLSSSTEPQPCTVEC